MHLTKNLKPTNNDKKMSKTQYKFSLRSNVYLPGSCPLSLELAMLQTAISQSCGKCVPCRNGLNQAELILKDIVKLKANEDSIDKLRELCEIIKDTADCVIGRDAANTLLIGLDIFRDEYKLHTKNKNCSSYSLDCAPCTTGCPANVNIPAYVSLIGEKRYVDALRVIRNDNPFVTACSYICEHPCENKCRRSILDDNINIKGLKKFAADVAAIDKVPIPKINESTGKKIAIVGGGPSGLTCAYYLGVMGHKVTVFEARSKLGGMLQYGIPNYRLPKKRLQQDINMILSNKNITVKTNVEIGKDLNKEKLVKDFDAVYIAIGAQIGKSIKLPGIKTKGVYSAVEMLEQLGEGKFPNYKNKSVVVIGGGSVAMDAARTAIRCGAKEVNVVYRRRQQDMTAMKSEIQTAIEEGVQLITLYAPYKITKNKKGHVSSLVAKPLMISKYDTHYRPSPAETDKPNLELKCDVILLAIGQDIVSDKFKDYGINEKRKTLIVNDKLKTIKNENIFAGGDCVLGPSTVIKAIADGKKAAVSIDAYLGYHHKFKEKIDMPEPKPNMMDLYGRSNFTQVPAKFRKNNFNQVLIGLSYDEAMQECKKCLRCDHYGCNTVERVE